MDDSDRLFANGNPNPNKFGRSLRWSAGAPCDSAIIEQAAQRLGRPKFLIDDRGYECDLFGAAINAFGDIAYVESRAKDVGYHKHGFGQRQIDVSIRVHLMRHIGNHESADIESYNPFFGCDVRFFEWIDQTALLIYREKHWTIACRIGDTWPPRFLKIEDRWLIHDNILSFIGFREDLVRRLNIPHLVELGPVSISEAMQTGSLPPDRKAR